MKKLIKITMIAIAALLLSCIGLAALGSTLPRSETPATRPAAAEATNAPAPTTRPEPTAASLPTAEPVATDALDVMAYSRAMTQHATTISGALNDISKLSEHPRLGDANWQIDMATAFAILRAENVAMQQITPPASMQTIHDEILLATADLDAMTYRYAKGIDTLDANEIRAATKLMESGTRHIVTATELMQAK